MINRRLVGRKSGKIDRAVKVAYTNAKAKIPRDTGTLQGSLQLRQTPNGYTMFFRKTDLNPRSKKPVSYYIDYVERYHEGWWDTTVQTFFSELSRNTQRPIRKK